MNAASSLARNATAAAISSACQTDRAGYGGDLGLERLGQVLGQLGQDEPVQPH